MLLSLLYRCSALGPAWFMSHLLRQHWGGDSALPSTSTWHTGDYVHMLVCCSRIGRSAAVCDCGVGASLRTRVQVGLARVNLGGLDLQRPPVLHALDVACQEVVCEQLHASCAEAARLRGTAATESSALGQCGHWACGETSNLMNLLKLFCLLDSIARQRTSIRCRRVWPLLGHDRCRRHKRSSKMGPQFAAA